MSVVVKKSLSVYNNDGNYSGRLEAYGGDNVKYALTFYPVNDADFSKEDLEEIVEEIKCWEGNL